MTYRAIEIRLFAHSLNELDCSCFNELEGRANPSGEDHSRLTAERMQASSPSRHPVPCRSDANRRVT
jgi:hypothetical protein